MTQGGGSTQSYFLKSAPQYSVLGLDSGGFLEPRQKSQPSPYYPVVGSPGMGRDLLNVEHFSMEFFTWKQSKKMCEEQRLQKCSQHSPTHRSLVGRKVLFQVSPALLSELCRPWILLEPMLSEEVFGKDKKAVCPGAGCHLKHGPLCCL